MTSGKWKYLLGLLSLIAATVWLGIITFPGPKLHLVACDVGQGDAILAVYGSTQILVDGGPDNRVLDCLSRHMPFWDREIEVVILTHPQKDHFGGLIEVFRRYKVGLFLANSLDSSSQDYKVLKNVVGGSGVEVINPFSGMVIRLGLMQLDILWPTNDFWSTNVADSTLSGSSSTFGSLLFPNSASATRTQQSADVLDTFVSSRNANDFSIVAILRLGEFDVLMTGDIGPDVMDEVLEQFTLSGSRRMEYVKVPHHGSKNGLTRELLDASDPEVAVISAGANNQYGHPHEEVIKLLNDQDIKILRTDEIGDVEVVSDGESWWVE